MKKTTSEVSDESGLELDKIRLPKLPADSAAGKAAPEPSPPPAPEKPGPRKRGRSRLAPVIALGILAVLISVIVLFRQQHLSLNFLNGETAGTENAGERYLRVGPISATLANQDIIIFSLEIDCGDEGLKKRLTARDSQLRDSILSVITAPGTDTLIRNNQYDEVKAKIRKNLSAAVSESIEGIYFAEMIIY